MLFRLWLVGRPLLVVVGVTGVVAIVSLLHARMLRPAPRPTMVPLSSAVGISAVSGELELAADCAAEEVNRCCCELPPENEFPDRPDPW